MRSLKIESLEVRNCMSILGATFDAVTNVVSVERSAGDHTTDFRVTFPDSALRTSYGVPIKSITEHGTTVNIELLYSGYGDNMQFNVDVAPQSGVDNLVAIRQDTDSTGYRWDGMPIYRDYFSGTLVFTPQGEHLYYSPTVTDYNMVADLNGDGRMDLAGCAPAQSVGSNISTSIRTGYDDIYSGFTERSDSSGRLLGFGDFNKDGHADVIDWEGGAVVIRYWTTGNYGFGDGYFVDGEKKCVLAGGWSDPWQAVVAGDFNNDGNLDLIVGETYGLTRYFQNDGHGNFNAPVTVLPAVNGGQGYGGNLYSASGDFNGDGNLDFVGVTQTTGFTLMLGNGDGTFRAGTQVATGLDMTPFFTGDFNHDGKTDLAWYDRYCKSDDTSKVSFVLGGSSTIQTIQTPFACVKTATTGDFNGDGIADFAAAGPIDRNDGNSDKTAIYYGNSDGTYTEQIINQQADTLLAGNFKFWHTVATTPAATPVPQPDPVTPAITGTTGNDIFEFNIRSSTLTVNGVSQTLTGSYTIDGLGGNDTVWFYGATDADISYGSGTVGSISYANMETVAVCGTGTATLYDSINNDFFQAGMGFAQMSAGTSLLAAYGFQHVNAESTQGSDAARLYSTDATLSMNTATATVECFTNFNCHIAGFKTVESYSRGGTANFVGTGSDLFITSPMGSQFRSNGFDFSAWGFDHTTATGGGIARFYGTIGGTGETFNASLVDAVYQGMGFDRRAVGFKHVEEYAPHSTATLTGTSGTDRAVTSALGAQLFGSDYEFSAWGCDGITVNGGGGSDRADTYGGLNRIVNDFQVTNHV